MREAILAVSFGSTVDQARSRDLEGVEQALSAAAPELPLFRAYTSGLVRARLGDRGIAVPDVAGALEQMAAEGIECALIVPTHLLPGAEYDKIRETAARWEGRFPALRLSRPLLGTPEDLRDYMVGQGCQFAVMMDGGGKVNLYVKSENVLIQGKDPSQNLILLYLDDGETEEAPVSEKKTVCLDPGHDASNLANKSPDGTYYEHEFALDMGNRIKAILERYGVAVTMTRTGGEAVSLAQRCKIANNIRGLDLFVSLHSNAAAGSGWSSASGWSAYVFSKTSGGYTAAQSILEAVRAAGIAVRSTPIVEAPSLYVLKGTVAPAVLIEHGFHTNEGDVKNLRNSSYRQRLAEAEARGILDYLGIAWEEEDAPEPAEPTEAEKAVEWITSEGIMLGNSAGDLMLDQGMTRKQFAVMLYRYHKKFHPT